MQEGSKKISGQAEKGKEATTAKATVKTEESKSVKKASEPKKEATAAKAEPAKKAEAKKEEPVKKAEPKKEAAKKEAAESEPAAKAAKKPAAKSKKAPKEPVVPELILEYNDKGEQKADMADVIAKIKAAYVAEGHRESSIKALRVYLKPQDWKAYYVINNKIEGQIDLF